MSAADLIQSASDYFEIPAIDITGPRRLAALMPARSAVAYVLRNRDGFSYPRVGAALGGRDHTSSQHLVKVVALKMAENHDFAAFIEAEMSQGRVTLAPRPKLVPLPEALSEPLVLEEVEDSLGTVFTLDQHGWSREERFDRRNTIRGSRLLAKALREAMAA